MNNAIAIKQYMSSPGIQNKLNELLGERKDVFLTSALQVVSSNKMLKDVCIIGIPLLYVNRHTDIYLK